MPSGALARVVRTTVLAVSAFALASAVGAAAPAAGTPIVNAATVSYVDAHGQAFTAQSNTVVVSVAAVSAITVSPKEAAVDATAEGYPAGSPITRTFTIVNGGNVADAYVVTAAQAGAGSIASISYVSGGIGIPVTLTSTVTPTLGPGESIAVAVTLATAGVAVGTAFPISLTARSTNTAAANGTVTDSGRAWAIAQAAASLAGPSGPNTAVTKLVNSVRTHPALPGDVVTYQIAFKNYGGSSASNVVIVDKLPVGVTALPATVTLNGINAASLATLQGQTLSIKAGTLATAATGTVTFDAQVASGAITGVSFVNVATVQADGIAPLVTTPASIFVGLANIVYDGFAGGKTPIGGALLTLRDFATKAVVALPSTGTAGGSALRAPLDTLLGVPPAGLAPNTLNANPFSTGSDGAYSFVFDQTQLGSVTHPAVYELDVAAAGYRARQIQITVTPDLGGVLYDVTLHELDGQQLALPGGFGLVTPTVSLAKVFGLLGNLPMFAPHPLAVSKTVDRDVASGGDRVLYTVQVGSSNAAFGATNVVDTLPTGVVYAPGSARIDNVPREPVRAGRTLTWSFPNLAVSHAVTYACVVSPSASVGATLLNVVDVSALSASGTTVTASASADTRVVAGALGDRIVVTGRVFLDVHRSGRFREGDRGVAAVRVYLEDGESVITDAYGRFTFPSVHPGQHVLRVDAGTLPANVRAYDDRRYDSPKSLTRLVHGLYDAGLMQDVNFAVESRS